ncbi:hypothetical protein GCM10010530_44100 [Kribbella aluminosa]
MTLPIDRIDDSVGRAIRWLITLLPEEDGSAGIWERLRIDQDDAVVRRVRPDCTAETAALLDAAGAVQERPDYGKLAGSMRGWLQCVQRPDGGFPFYELTPAPNGTADDGATADLMWPNDNGKVLELLCLGDYPRESTTRLASYLIDNQREDGWFSLDAVDYRGPCFVSWPVVGLARYYASSGDERAAAAVTKAIGYLRSLQCADGRLKTTYEISGTENWRPVSSETAEALRAFALAHRLVGLDTRAEIAGCREFLTRLTTAEGAIRNCDAASVGASEQADPALTDLVYTCGYALHGWLDAWRATGERSDLAAAVSLGEFLISIQVDDPSVAWDGAWRGSYDVDQRTWRGRANQSNPIDEGGEFSVYTGWTTATIATGLLRIRNELARAPR